MRRRQEEELKSNDFGRGTISARDNDDVHPIDIESDENEPIDLNEKVMSILSNVIVFILLRYCHHNLMLLSQ